MSPSESDEMKALIGFLQSQEPEVSGRALVSLSGEEKNLVNALATGKLPSDLREKVIALLATNQTALELLAQILKMDDKVGENREDVMETR